MTDYLLDYSELEERVIANYPTGWFKDNAPSKRFHTFQTFQNYLDMANTVLEFNRHIVPTIQNFKLTTTISEKPEMSNDNKQVIMNKKELRRIKIKVSNQKESKAVQEELFRYGCYWLTYEGLSQFRNTTAQCCDSRYLYVESSGLMLHGSSEDYFDKSEYTEIKADVRNFEATVMMPTILTKTEVHTFYKEKETVEFGGKKYIKEDLEKALSLLKSV